MSSDPTANPTAPPPPAPFASNFQPIPNPPQTKRSGVLAPGIALVTGGASGLGNAIARSFARDGAKAVVIVDIGNEERLSFGKKRIEDIGTEVSVRLTRKEGGKGSCVCCWR